MTPTKTYEAILFFFVANANEAMSRPITQQKHALRQQSYKRNRIYPWAIATLVVKERNPGVSTSIFKTKNPASSSAAVISTTKVVLGTHG